MPRIEHNGVPICWRDAGAGEPVVLLHGSASTGGFWRGVTPWLEDRFRMITPDLCGYGETGLWHGRKSFTLSDEAALVIAVIAKIGEPVHLVGHSYGGAVALRTVIEQPGLIRSLTLIEPVAFHLLQNGTKADRAIGHDVVPVARAFYGAMADGDRWGAMERFVGYWSGEGVWARMDSAQRDQLAGFATKIALDFRATFNETAPLGAYRRIRVPTRLLRGGKSPRATRRIAEILAAAIPNARLTEVPEAGHMLPWTHAADAGRIILEHLRDGVETEQAAFGQVAPPQLAAANA